MKKFVGASYWGIFIRGGQLPLLATSNKGFAEWQKSILEKDNFYKDYRLIVKRCVMGRLLTQPATPDAAKETK